MHVVIWTSKSQRYATPSEAIVEVIPVVLSRPMPGGAPWLTGLFDYRGSLLQLFDSSLFLGHAASVIRMSSRILVVRAGEESNDTTRRVGIIVEQVLGAERIDFDDQVACSPAGASGIEFLGPVARTPGGTVQLTAPARLAALENPNFNQHAAR
jgi:chemotaxis signal transduction protein